MGQSSVRGERGRRAAVPEPREPGEDGSPQEGKRPASSDAGRRSSGKGRPSGNGRRGKERPQRSRGVRILRWTALTLAVLVLGAAGAGYFYYEHLNGNLKKEALDLGDSKIGKPEPNAAGQTPLNILLIGSDSRNTAENVKLGGAKQDADRKPLGDVQMLVHVSADRSNMSVVSIPRDTRVTIPQCTDPHDGTVYRKTEGAINESLQHGGPGCTVATWKELTGLYIDHFMMIDFSGVVSMADAIGGVPVCVNNNVYSHDSKGHGSGLKLTKGTHNVKGVQALQWLRTRYGFEDNTDIGRAKAQHMYMTSMIRQLKSGTKLSDPGKLMDLAEAATEALTVDHGLGTVKNLYDLGNDLKRVPTKRTTMSTMPWEYGGGGEYVLPKPGDAEQTFSLLRNDIALDGKDKKKPDATPAPTAPKEQIPVVVQNGTASTVLGPVSGRASVITSELVRLGYAKATANTELISQADTTVLYPGEDRQGDGLAVAKALKLPKAAAKSSTSVQDITVVVGNDWREGTAYPKPAADDDGKTPESADALNGEEKGCMKVNPGYSF
ncbi:LCP family protein [Streptomyces antimycoticus]|uniref:Transcriptional regulator n=1 Tax=Streptomyces antimycoticus TaxID=68175 RepID=A0A4D4K564_9ACTN|nr:LCP family protein [Streptomyces antimycoticus]BBJ43262.1 transcriptional regulator [Streptomyces antimycoticus]GDY43242.1 transcriptional regulator [Streptomyces antimycoticus]